MLTKQNIFLIGPMGSGKTAVGKHLARALKLTFHDTDAEIETRTGVDIPFIFEKEGEAGFRRREKQVIADLTACQNMVLATGGGAVLDAENRIYLAGRGFVVYLRASVDHQMRRTGRTESRPLLQSGNPRETLERLFSVRDPLYREVADLVIDADGGNARALAQEIGRHLDATPA